MIKKFWHQWLPVLFASAIAITLMPWAVYQERQVQGPIYLPGGFAFQAYLPSHYCLYCQMNDDLTEKANILSNMKMFPQIACEVKGAGHLDVLTVNVWRAGGLTRFVKDKSTGENVMLMPFAEFEILWPGNYELRAGFINPTKKPFLMCVGPTGLIGSSAILSILVLSIGFIFMVRKSLEIDRVRKRQLKAKAKPREEVVLNDE